MKNMKKGKRRCLLELAYLDDSIGAFVESFELFDVFVKVLKFFGGWPDDGTIWDLHSKI